MNSALPLTRFRSDVQREIEAALARQRRLLTPVGPETDRLVAALERLLEGGKRFRAAFCYWGYKAAGGTHDEAAIRLATSLEFFQAAALIHDDVMDDSAVRRGAPAAHVAFANEHVEAGWEGDPERFGLSGAVLAGDLCLVASDQVFAECGLPVHEIGRARPCFDAMRSQLMGGQLLEFVVSNRGWTGLPTDERIDLARKVVRFKSAKYSVEQPTLIGADAGGVSPTDRALLSTYGLALGEAFQLRDDVLGVFGDPATTGKPAGDDLREGKRTVLLALTLDTCSSEEREHLLSLVGAHDADDAAIERARAIMTTSGAVDRHEALITEGADAARAALDATTGLTPEGKDALSTLIDLTTARDT
ncbi:MAG: polyprenyl synthetase family protein [Dermatophilus congolensis]|nr:polyprenyl synthetase family protein [Dermatophilus congolensis]